MVLSEVEGFRGNRGLGLLGSRRPELRQWGAREVHPKP